SSWVALHVANFREQASAAHSGLVRSHPTATPLQATGYGETAWPSWCGRTFRAATVTPSPETKRLCIAEGIGPAMADPLIYDASLPMARRASSPSPASS